MPTIQLKYDDTWEHPEGLTALLETLKLKGKIKYWIIDEKK